MCTPAWATALSSVYKKAMVVASKKYGLVAQEDYRIQVLFEGEDIGTYEPDLIINDCVIAELKTAKALAPEHEAQLLNYLKATNYEVGFLFNFGQKAQYRRMVFDNERKGNISWVRHLRGNTVTTLKKPQR